MQENILQRSDIVKIYLCFTDGKKVERKESVIVRALDEKNCYFAGDSIVNLSKPGMFAKAKIFVFTKEGTFAGEGRIVEIDFSLDKILYTIGKPRKWDFTQLRVGERKTTCLPVEMQFNEEHVINTEIVNLSYSGFSVNIKENLTSLEMKLPCNCKIKLANEEIEIKAKYVRQQLILDDYQLAGYKACSFRFVNLFPNQKAWIKNYLNEIS